MISLFVMTNIVMANAQYNQSLYRIYNAGFEHWYDRTSPEGWKGTGDYYWSTDPVHSGDYAVCFDQLAQLQTQTYQLAPGDYGFSIEVQAQDGVSRYRYLTISVADDDNTGSSQEWDLYNKYEYHWNSFELNFSLKKTSNVSFTVSLRGHGDLSSKLFIDDCLLGAYNGGAILSSDYDVTPPESPDFVYYCYNDNTAELARCKNTGISGVVEIPATITNKGKSYKVTKVCQEIFMGCSNITDIILPQTISEIGRWAFAGCTSLSSIVMPTANLDYDTFFGCEKLSTIEFMTSNTPTFGREKLPYNSDLVLFVPDVNLFSSITGVTKRPLAFCENIITYNGKIPDYSLSCAPNVSVTNINTDRLRKDVGTYYLPATFVHSSGMSVEGIIPIVIEKKDLTIKVENASKLYGDLNPKFNVTYEGFVNGETSDVLLSLPTTFSDCTKSSPVGEYEIVANNAKSNNYDFTYINGILTVEKAPIQITVNNTSKVYGAINPSFTYTVSGLKNNQTSLQWIEGPFFSTLATTKSDVGDYDVEVNGTFQNYYISVMNPGKLTVEPASLILEVNDATRLYYADDPAFTYTCSGFVNDDDVSVLTKQPVITPDAVRSSDVGAYNLTAKDAIAKNYDISYLPGKLTITKRPLIITADDATREYGEPNPIFTCSYEGFVGGETESVLNEIPKIMTTANNYSKVGTYDLRVSGGQATNYTFSYQTGTLTITNAPLSAKVIDTTKVYGQDNPSFSIEYFGLKNGETVPSWVTTPSFHTEATKASGVGQYAITAVNGVPVNYDLEIADGTLSITPAPLTIRANNTTRQYYSENPTFNYTCSGFVNGDNTSVLVSPPTLTTTATLTSDVGTYEIKVGETTTPNYSISYVNGTLTITKRTLIASVGNYERAYNEENPVFEVKLDGFVGDEDEQVISAKPTAKTSATKTSDVGTYRIEVTGGNADNYNFSYTYGTLTINKAEQIVTWEQDLSGLQVGDQVELKAVASSGLPVTYTVEDERFAEVYSVGENYYLDCKKRGKFAMRAVQYGNKNYYSSPRATNNVTISGGQYEDFKITLSNAGYATFYDEFCDYMLPSGLKASVVTSASDSKLTYKMIADGTSGGIIPAGTAVLLQGRSRSAETYTLTPKESTTSYTGNNLLHGSDEATVTTADGDCVFYKLAYGPSGTALSNTLGWFWGSRDGKPFSIEGHKAWLAIPKGSAVKPRPLFYSIDGNAIELETFEISTEDKVQGTTYDLSGRRVDQPSQRGIYIRDGKKVVVK